MSARVLFEPEIRELVGPAEALAAVRDAFVALARGEVTLPGVIELELPEHEGEVHVKGAYLHGAPTYSFNARADKVVADRLQACLENGEIHRAVAAGAIAAEDVHAELGQIAAGERPGRESDDEITVVQDAALATLVVTEAAARSAGRPLEP